MPVRVENQETKAEMMIWVMLDSCSDWDIFAIEIAETLGIKTALQNLRTTTVESDRTGLKHMGDITISSIQSISSTDREFEAEVEDAVFIQFPTTTADTPPCLRDVTKYDHLKNVPFPTIEGKRVMGIISAAHHSSWMGGEIIRGRKTDPFAFHTLFGWTISGPTGKKGTDQMSTFKVSIDNVELRDKMDKIFMNDFPTVLSEDEVGDSYEAREAHKQIKESARFDEGKGKYISGLPWRNGRKEAAKILNAVDSDGMSIKRLESLKRSMQRSEEKLEKGFIEVRKFLANGRAEIVDEKEFKNKPEDRVQWTLPGHLVFQKNKWRFCHDGRASIDGICLNEELIGALNLLTPILDPVMNLRNWLHALTTDIEAFFHNILVDELDKDAFLFYV